MRSSDMDSQSLQLLQEEGIVFPLDIEQLIALNQQVSHSLRKKGIKLREFKWNEVQAS
ncbi:hypothetical protein HYU13_02255 [Candidatus Woesearchaeota archaeon]|nr:hypothetical protein [Candidatus Woesearchaeota archaeon]